MAKNFFKTIFNSNKDKNNNGKNLKINPSYKLSEILTNSKNSEDSSKILQQQQQTIDPYNLLLNYYSQKDENNTSINNFMEKINKLNKKFYASSEKFILTKTSFDKLSDELFLNLFKQIDCYVEEIQRLNKKISSIDNKENKIMIKQLTKELSENKVKIRNYENKLKEKTLKEEKLSKELDSYKRRIIFFKNKININLMARNSERRQHMYKNNRDNNNGNNSIISKNSSKNVNFYRNRRYTQKLKTKRLKSFFSPSPGKSSKNNKDQSFFSSKNDINLLPKEKEDIDTNNIETIVINNNNTTSNLENNTILDFKNNKNNNNLDLNKDTINNSKTINSNKEITGIFSDGEAEDNKNRVLITINRKLKQKETIMVPFNRNYNKDDETIDNNSSRKNNKNNFEDLEKNITIDNEKKENKITPRKTLEESLNINSAEVPKKLNKIFKNIKSSKCVLNNKDKKEINENKRNNLDSKNKSKSKNKNKLILISFSNKNSNIKNKNYKAETNKKITSSKKLFNLPSKKLIKSNLKNTDINNINNKPDNNNNNIINNHSDDVKIKTIDNTSNIGNTDNNNTLEDIKNNTMNSNRNIGELSIMKSKTVKFNQNTICEKSQKSNCMSSEDENIDISSKDQSINSLSNKKKVYKKNRTDKTTNKISSSLSGDISDILNKETTHNDYLNNGHNSTILEKNKKLSNKTKKIMSIKSVKNVKEKRDSNKQIKTPNKDMMKLEQKNKEKEKELTKILKEMNEDYNNDIEMLKTQEEQIKLLLSLIDLNEN